MDPILLILIVIYLIIVLTKNIFSNNEIAESTNPIIGNVIIFIRNNVDNIYLTIFVMLGLIIYFAVIGVNLDEKPTKKLEGEILVEKFENLGKDDKNDKDFDLALGKEKVKDKVIEQEYAKSHHKVTQTLSSIERDKKCREKVEHTCEIDPNCIWCLGPDKGCYGGSSAGITHASNNEKCNHFMFNGKEYKHIRDGLGITHEVN